ncbi:MAG: pantetheine-phosphate adenylyltransferase [bacterium]
MTIALYPGTFDPVTNGHIDLMLRARRIFKSVLVAVAENPSKKPYFSLAQRIDMIENSLKERSIDDVRAVSFNSLMVDCAKEYKAAVIIRGLRAVSDFEYELQMALINRKLYSKVETIFMTPDQDLIFLSSSTVKELARFGGCIKNFVPQYVYEKIREYSGGKRK